MALFKILKGSSSNLSSQSKREGYCYVTTDEKKMYIDINNSTRICLNAAEADVAKKLGTVDVGTATLPIYLKAGVPTSCNSTLGVDVSGNANSATKLNTARKINGTSFNGTQDITTAEWGATRTITIGNSGKSVNGSANVSWSHADIGATVSNAWTAGTTSGPQITTTVNGVTGAAVAIPKASTTASGIVTTGAQRFRGVKTLEYPAISSNNSRYLGMYYKNKADTMVGEHWYDTGDATNITTGRYSWRQYSPNSTANASTTGFYETFYLPAVDTGRTNNASYEIFTSKSYSTLDTRYLKLSGGNITGNIYNTCEGARYQASDGTNTMWVGVNGYGTLMGLYDVTHSKFLIESDTATGNVKVNGNAATATKLATARTIRTNLASTSTASFDGSANITPGVTGTLAVGNGGTGKTSFSAGYLIIGNGTSALKTTNIHVNYSPGTASTTGYEELVIGNSTSAGTAGNTVGKLSLYSSKNAGVYLVAADATSWSYTNILPASNGTLLNTSNYSTYALPKSGGTLSGSITISHATNNIMDKTTTNPRIVFADQSTQPVGLVYTDYDNYRSPAGLKVLNMSDNEKAWFEVEGDVYASSFIGPLSGNASTATKLATARTIRTNLASTSTASFDGTANITPGVTGVLPITNGGTGADTRLKAIKNLGVFGLYNRNEIGTSPNFDNPGVNGYFELRSKSETTGETGTKPYDGFGPFISINYSNTMFQLAGTNTSGFFIRGKQAANVTLAGVSWQKLLTSDNWSDYAAAKSHTHNNYVPLSGGTMTGSLATPGLSISNKSAQYTSLNMHGSGRFYFQMIPDSNSVRNHLRYIDSATGKYIDYYLGNDATSLSETKGYHILTAENYSSYALPLSGGTITGQLNVKGAFVAENTSYMYGSIISAGSGLYDSYNNNNYEMIVSYKNGNTVLGASGGGLYIGYQNTTHLNIGNLGNWAYWDASVLRLNQEIQSTNVHPLRSVYGDYGMIFRNDGSSFWFLPTAAGDQYGGWAKTYTRINLASGQIYGAVWNDYAEFRQYTDSEEIPYGRVVCENGDGSLSISTKRLQLGANICSDTFGQAIGEKDDVKMPIAVAGRVLAYPYEDRNSYIPGEPVCAGPNGTVSKMTREEIKEYPECIIGTVSEVPQYEEWNEIKVNNRIWIKVK